VCRPVNATNHETGFFEGEELCDGWDYCISGTLTGTFVGTMMEYFSAAYEMFDVFGTGDPVNTYAGETRISTRHGHIWGTIHGSYDFSSYLWTEIVIVKGGTGKYENATGRMVIHDMPTAHVQPIGGVNTLAGFICTP
jgi:hypothetical protein